MSTIPTPRTDAEASKSTVYFPNFITQKHDAAVSSEFARQLERELHQCRIALGITDGDKIVTDCEAKHGSILVEHGSTRKRISPVDDEVVRLTDELTAAKERVAQLYKANDFLSRRSKAKDETIAALEAANEKIISSAPLTEQQRGELAAYVRDYVGRGIKGVWHDLATGIAALMNDNDTLRTQSEMDSVARWRDLWREEHARRSEVSVQYGERVARIAQLEGALREIGGVLDADCNPQEMARAALSSTPVKPSPVPDPPSDINPDTTKEDGDKAFAEYVAAERAKMTPPVKPVPQEVVKAHDVALYAGELGISRVCAAYGDMDAKAFQELWQYAFGEAEMPESLNCNQAKGQP